MNRFCVVPMETTGKYKLEVLQENCPRDDHGDPNYLQTPLSHLQTPGEQSWYKSGVTPNLSLFRSE
jgi:hypothetical protein